MIVRSGDWPRQYFIKGKVPPVKNQQTQGSCDAHTSTSIEERLYSFVHGMDVVFSPSYAYWMIRKLEGTLDQGDCGGQITSALIVPDPNAPGGTGNCPLSLMPYNPNVWTVAPTQTQIDATKNYPGGSYHNIGPIIANMKSCILSDYPFAIGIAVYDSFEDDSTAASGLIPFPNVDAENLLGYHALHCGIGFDDDKVCPNAPYPGAILLENSWGNQWGTTAPQSGERGFAWIPYAFLLNGNLTTDQRMAHLGRPW
jgi:C1A family cysteine protease